MCVQAQPGGVVSQKNTRHKREGTGKTKKRARNAMCVQAQPGGVALLKGYHTKNENLWFKINYHLDS